jgi:RNA polymerase sigma-B factor
VRDIAQHLVRTPEQIVEAVHAGELHSLRSIDAPVRDAGDEGPELVDCVADTRRELATAEDGVTLRQLSTVLKDRDWEVIRLRYQEDLFQREIAERIGCTQMHVSRILSASLRRLEAAAAC